MSDARGVPERVGGTRDGGTRDGGTRRSTHDVEAERLGWYEVSELVRSLTPAECLEPGYYSDPAWTVRDLVAHLGTWLAEAEVQLARIGGGTYESHEVDIDALNAALLAGMEGQPWEVAWIQANAARTEMLDAWTHLHAQDDEAGRWIRKSGSDHYGEHLERLRQWCAELVRRRATDTAAVPGGPATQGMAGPTRLEPTPPTGAEGAP